MIYSEKKAFFEPSSWHYTVSEDNVDKLIHCGDSFHRMASPNMKAKSMVPWDEIHRWMKAGGAALLPGRNALVSLPRLCQNQ